jgi:hypothetical protein
MECKDGIVSTPKGLRSFTFGELWAGSEGMCCQGQSEKCEGRTFTVWLSSEEVKQVNQALPDQVMGDGIAHGPEAATIICEKSIGLVLCFTCAENH